MGGRAFRFHDAASPPSTARRRLDLTHPACRIELLRAEDSPQLHIWDGPASLTLRGAYLWALAPYLEARIADMPREGWLDLDAERTRRSAAVEARRPRSWTPLYWRHAPREHPP